MKLFAKLLALCIFLMPAAAFAQAPPPMPPPGGMPPPDFAAIREMHKSMEHVHSKERADVLAALTPAHRALVASLMGELAIAVNPDTKSAAAKLDGALSASEKAAVESAHKTAMSQMHDMMTKAMAQRPHPEGSPQFFREMHRNPPSPGQLVLEILGPGPEHNVMYMTRGGMAGRKPPPPPMNPPGSPNP